MEAPQIAVYARCGHLAHGDTPQAALRAVLTHERSCDACKQRQATPTRTIGRLTLADDSE